MSARGSNMIVYTADMIVYSADMADTTPTAAILSSTFQKVFYVPERSIMNLTVSACFLIRFCFSRILDFSECIMFLNRTGAIKKYYARVL